MRARHMISHMLIKRVYKSKGSKLINVLWFTFTMASSARGAVVCVCLLFALASGRTIKSRLQDTKCGYSSCNPVKDDMINVHIVPHTHDDVGWLITVDQYYFERVQYILDSVIPELLKDPSKRFIYVEIAFFERWFREQHDSMRHAVRQLVNEGRLEFILGGWCMNDEGATHYNAIIDQHTLGFEYLRENFGKCGKPRVAWQIDPFGHSREQASIFARFGFDSLFFGRLDYQDKANREKHRTMEMMWRGSPKNLGEAADLFTGALPNGYNPPDGFCFDIFCSNTPIVDDTRLHDVNVKEMVDLFLDEMALQAQHYATNHLITTMGSDFQYQAAHNWYLNLDKLIKYVNARQANGSKVNLLYSTPSCYTYQLNRANKTWTTKEDDFFPYAHRPHSFWTGYFTSRPTFKGYVRRTNNFLQVIKQLDALALLEDTDNSTYNLIVLEKAMGVAQHHDAVSGTEKQVVTYDYEERLANGIMEGQKVYNDAMKKLEAQSGGAQMDHFFCSFLNISVCSMTENGNQFIVTVYNPIARTGSHYVRLPVSSDAGVAFSVMGPDGKTVPSEVVPVSPDTFRIPERKGNTAKYELVFPVNLVPLGFNTFVVSRNKGQFDKYQKKEATPSYNEDIVIQNEFIAMAFSKETGMLKNMTNLQKKVSIDLTQSLMYYQGDAGNNSRPQFQASGAYIFRPNGTSPYGGRLDRAILKSKTYFMKGELVQEVYQEFSPWLTQTVKLYNGQPFAEFQWTVGPIPIKNGQGKEVVSRFESSLKNNEVFYTDANGREILKRQLNYRATWDFNNTEPISGNYFPVNSRMYIRDEAKKVQLTVLTDRSQGGTSLQEGQIELMVHRRLLYDDALGVDQALNETGCDGKGLIARGSHYVMLEPIASAAAGHRDLAERLFMAPQISFSKATSRKMAAIWSGVRQALPDNVHLLTLEQYPSDGPVPSDKQPFLLRLEHFYEKGEDPVLSKPVTLHLQKMFSTFDIMEATELTLGGDMALSDVKRLKWNYPHEQSQADRELAESSLLFKSQRPGEANSDPLTITLNPMEIKTFQISIRKR